MRTYDMDQDDERTPLLQFPGQIPAPDPSTDHRSQHGHFCMLVGVPPSHLTTAERKKFTPSPSALYVRATKQRRTQSRTYAFTAALSNTLLLSQVILGAALTGLGASESSHILITVFGALNTVIAGVIAYLKSRGQPMRARMFRDDLERVVDEIENSEIMWLGISRSVNGYSDIDTDDMVTVRSEVARLTRLYDRVVKTNTLNDPDIYAAGQSQDGAPAALRARPVPGQPLPAVAVPPPPPSIVAPVPARSISPARRIDPDESPATARPKPATPVPEPADKKDDADKPKTDEPAKDDAHKPDEPDHTPLSPPHVHTPLAPDESPATAPLWGSDSKKGGKSDAQTDGAHDAKPDAQTDGAHDAKPDAQTDGAHDAKLDEHTEPVVNHEADPAKATDGKDSKAADTQSSSKS